MNKLPATFFHACRRAGAIPGRDVLLVSAVRQRVTWFQRRSPAATRVTYQPWRDFIASTSRFGTGQVAGSNRTPLGLHRIAQKVGGGWPVGTVFESREAVGLTWAGRPAA